MTFPLFLSALSGDDSSDGRVRGRFARDSVAGEVRQVSRRVDALDGYAIPELLARIRNDDREAFAVLYSGLFHSLWTVAITYTHSSAIAEDLVHDVFLRLWVRRDTIKLDTDIRVYLTVAVRNHARNLTKHDRVVEAAGRTASVPGASIPAIGQSTPSPDLAVEDEEFHVAYQRLLGTLTERERTAVFLRWEQGFTLDQIAEVLSVSIEGVRKIIVRVQQKAQKILADYRS